MLKTLFQGLAVALVAAPPLAAMPDTLRERALLFASCTGRYSAAMEHDWLMGRDGKEAAGHRAMFEDLLDSIRPDALRVGLAGKDILHIRITAKFAQARLLQLGSFDDNETARRRARAAARRALRVCDTLVFV